MTFWCHGHHSARLIQNRPPVTTYSGGRIFVDKNRWFTLWNLTSRACFTLFRNNIWHKIIEISSPATSKAHLRCECLISVLRRRFLANCDRNSHYYGLRTAFHTPYYAIDIFFRIQRIQVQSATISLNIIFSGYINITHSALMQCDGE